MNLHKQPKEKMEEEMSYLALAEFIQRASGSSDNVTPIYQEETFEKIHVHKREYERNRSQDHQKKQTTKNPKKIAECKTKSQNAFIPEMVEPMAVLHPPLEFPDISAPILAGVNTAPMALPVRPLSRIHVPCVEPVYAESVPEALPVLPPVPASPRPSLHAVAVVFVIDPVPFVPPTHVIVVHPAPRAPAPVELTLVHITVAVHLNPRPRGRALLRLGFHIGADGPENGRRRTAAAVPRMDERGREGNGREEVEQQRAIPAPAPAPAAPEDEVEGGEEEEQEAQAEAAEEVAEGGLGGGGGHMGQESEVVPMVRGGRRRRRRRCGRIAMEGVKCLGVGEGGVDGEALVGGGEGLRVGDGGGAPVVGAGVQIGTLYLDLEEHRCKHGPKTLPPADEKEQEQVQRESSNAPHAPTNPLLQMTATEPPTDGNERLVWLLFAAPFRCSTICVHCSGCEKFWPWNCGAGTGGVVALASGYGARGSSSYDSWR
ncbi:hypothetical protein Taro_019910 [Colocasia esculenta]|uniref:Uncharacterized protein n=1 Tax=Colocasia esculenta TaxID=4460 RepID=A0A843UY34_COLES|nr:hypothetical protein [Colocasia esculenta]